mgnify:CR=1 FL=1
MVMPALASQDVAATFRSQKFTQFEAYYVMPDMKWYDYIKVAD